MAHMAVHAALTAEDTSLDSTSVSRRRKQRGGESRAAALKCLPARMAEVRAQRLPKRSPGRRSNVAGEGRVIAEGATSFSLPVQREPPRAVPRMRRRRVPWGRPGLPLSALDTPGLRGQRGLSQSSSGGINRFRKIAYSYKLPFTLSVQYMLPR